MTAYDTAVIADSPWFYGKTDEASGLLQDSSGNSRHLNIPGGFPTYAQSGPDGSSADAQIWPDSSGATDYYAVSTASPGSGTAFTLECWFYFTTTPANPTVLCGIAYGYGNNSRRPLELYIDTDGKLKLFGGSSGTTSWSTPVASASAVSANTWHHAFAIAAPTAQTLRLDKATVGSAGNSTSVTSSDFFFVHGGGADIGGIAGDLRNGSQIVLSKPALYLTALTTTRGDAHYDAMGSVGTPTPTKLTGTWGLVA